MGGIAKRDSSNAYHMLPESRFVVGASCWHCCECVDDNRTVIPIPRVYDTHDGTYHVYGRTCSPECAKAYIIEHTTFDRGQHLNVFAHMMREVFGWEGPVYETPPRPALKRFGGVFDPSKQSRVHSRLLEPPFVSYCMVVEERLGPETTVDESMSSMQHQPTFVEEADMLDEPDPPALFEQYMQDRVSGKIPSSSEAVVGTTARKKRAHVVAKGPMSKFCKTTSE